VPERLDKVGVSLTGGVVTIAWMARELLLEQFEEPRPGEHDLADETRHVFEAVGATRPAELTREQKIYVLLKLIQLKISRGWFDGSSSPYEDPRKGIEALHDALQADLQDTPQPGE
jgi:hypothetical protein